MAYTKIDAVYIQSVDGKEVIKITDIYDPHSLCFSPDGSLLTYVAGNSNFVFSNALGNIAPSSIWVVASSGGDPIQIRENKHWTTQRSLGSRVYRLRGHAPGIYCPYVMRMFLT